MKIAALPLVALLSLPGAARAELPAEPELPTPAASDDAQARVNDELGDDAATDDAAPGVARALGSSVSKAPLGLSVGIQF